MEAGRPVRRPVRRPVAIQVRDDGGSDEGGRKRDGGNRKILNIFCR